MIEVRIDPDSLAGLPPSPGVYIMKSPDDEVLYIGKALNLRNRVRSYFTGSGDTRFSVQFLRRLAARVECIVTANEKEAFLLENELIKLRRPRFNIQLRDDKTFVSLRLRMNHDYPRLEIVRVRRHPGVKLDRNDMYFGPYSSAGAVRETMRFLLKVFPVRTCKDSVFANRTRPCILHDVGKCCGPCVLPVPREEYAKLVGSVALFLRGKKEEVKRALEERMEKFSDRMEFERAAMVRDRVAALDATLERQQVVSHGQSDRDVIAVASRQGRSFVVVMEHRDGVLSGTFDNYVKNHEHDDGEVLYGFLAQHFDAGRVIPPEILVSTMPDDSALLEEWLRERRGGAVTIHQPQRGDRLRLIESAAENARLGLERRLSGEQTSGEVLGELARKLGLESPPQTIECVDISNIMGVMAVGSLVRFEDALPDKDGYRRFRIRTVDGSNDYAMMREVLERRFRPEGTRAKGRPDLLLVDGGKGQLSSARRVLDELGVRDVALAAIAKSRLKKSPISAPDDQVGARKLFDDAGPEIAPEAYERVRTEERIFLPGRKNPVTFSRNSPALFILQRIRDEAHRFAITYHKQLRKKANRRSILEEIPGVGEKRRRALLRHFGSLVAVKAASVREIAAVGGVGEAAARMIVEFLEAGKPAGKQPDLIDTCAEDTTPVD